MNPQTDVPDSSSSDYVSYSQTETLAEERKPGGVSKFLGQARAYLVEYALVLISTGTLLSVTISMLGTILKYEPDDFGYFSSFAYKVSISLIATLLVAIPLVLLLTKRTNAVENEDPEIKNHSWRKGFLGFFLLNVGLWGIGFSVAFVYDFISYLASFGISDDNSFPWRSLLANGISALLLGFTMWLYSHDYRNQPATRDFIRKIHHYGLIAFAVLLTLIYLATAFKSQRASFVDDAISNDLRSIQSKASEYKSSHRGRLPTSLGDINLNDQQKVRAQKYDYSLSKTSGGYEVCAVFKTDTKSKDSGSQNPLEAFSGSSYSYNDSSSNSNPDVHEKGKQCFETKSTSNSRLNDLYPPEELNLDSQYQDETLSN